MTPRKSRFSLVFAPEVVQHISAIERKYHSLIAKTLDEQLTFAADEQTANRNLLEQPAPFEATWELRFGPHNRFRIFYDVNVVDREVIILAIGVKEGNRLWVGREEFRL